MNLIFNWYDNTKHVIVIRVQEAWSWDDFMALYQEYRPIIKAQPHEVCAIFDVRRDPKPPAGFLKHLPQLWHTIPDNLGMVVIVGSIPSTRTLWRIVNQVYAKIVSVNVVFEASIEEAYERILATNTRQDRL